MSGPSQTEVAAPTPEDLPNEARMWVALARLDNVLTNLDSLHSRITGNDSAAPELAHQGPRSLAEVLTTGPEILIQRTDEMHLKINEIEHTLFG